MICFRLAGLVELEKFLEIKNLAFVQITAFSSAWSRFISLSLLAVQLDDDIILNSLYNSWLSLINTWFQQLLYIIKINKTFKLNDAW